MHILFVVSTIITANKLLQIRGLIINIVYALIGAWERLPPPPTQSCDL